MGRGGRLIVSLRLFARAREAAGRSRDELDASTLGEVLDSACARYGEGFAAVLATSAVWINGDPPTDGRATRLADGDEIAVLPPVSGGQVSAASQRWVSQRWVSGP